MDISKHPLLYKKKSLEDIRNRNSNQITDEEKQRVNVVISKFFELFKTKHM